MKARLLAVCRASNRRRGCAHPAPPSAAALPVWLCGSVTDVRSAPVSPLRHLHRSQLGNASVASTLRAYAVKVQHRASVNLTNVCCGEQPYLDALPQVDGPFNSLLFQLDVAEPFYYAAPAVRCSSLNLPAWLLRECCSGPAAAALLVPAIVHASSASGMRLSRNRASFALTVSILSYFAPFPRRGERRRISSPTSTRTRSSSALRSSGIR